MVRRQTWRQLSECAADRSLVLHIELKTENLLCFSVTLLFGMRKTEESLFLFVHIQATSPSGVDIQACYLIITIKYETKRWIF
jgi:hypothetical protein